MLKFAALQSCVDVSFWTELGQRKLDTYKLSEDAVQITGYLSPSAYKELAAQITVDSNSFLADTRPPTAQHGIPGSLINTNTLESFKTISKQDLLKQVAGQIWADIKSGHALEDPASLSRFIMLTHGDLKQFNFYYWFAFPALKPLTPFTHSAVKPLEEALGNNLASKIAQASDTWRRAAGADSAPVSTSTPPAPVEAVSSSATPSSASSSSSPAAFWLLHVHASGVTTHRLSAWKQLSSKLAAGEQLLVAMSDPSNLPEFPGWPLRNLLLLASQHFGVPQLEVVCVRETKGRACPSRSIYLKVQLSDQPAPPPDWTPVAVGWEADANGKLAPRRVNVRTHMSGEALADQAVDLNLRLMRWRAAPNLDTTRLAGLKCLLLGSGTLGCVVARTLQAWGVRNITFLDNSKVSFSNPVRQSLFEHEDCLQGGKPKALAAAEKLHQILPSTKNTVSGIQLAIPMPGHPPEDEAQTQLAKEAAATLEVLVQKHDIIFNLTDTRESRWLPSLLAAVHRKIAITAALGFDSFVVMRHGGPPDAAAAQSDSSSSTSTKRLGCYFCNDVVAPLNSTLDRTLDQQCTVARPGLAHIAGALAVELVSALVQSTEGASTPTGIVPHGVGNPAEPSALGPVPHQLRGQLTGFKVMELEGHAFSQCTACSESVVSAYKERGWDFLLQAIKDPKSLEDLTGLTKLHADSAAMFADDEDDSAAAKLVGGDEDADDWLEL